MSDPNTFDKELEDAKANPTNPDEGAEGEGTPENPTGEGEQPVDYKTKFAESSREAQRLLDETKRLQAELLAKANQIPPQKEQPIESLYPGFEELDPDAQKNLLAYTGMIEKKTLESVYKDPSIKFAKEQYNTSRWESAFGQVIAKYPELAKDKDAFKTKYFKSDVVPDNIGTILEDLAKIHLFDSAKTLGAQEEKAKAGRIDLARTTGGDKTPKSIRSLEDWQRLQNENPAKFAQLSKEFNADMASGKI